MTESAKHHVFESIADTGIIPVIRVESPELATRAVAALQHAGLRIAEITMTVPDAIKVIEKIRSEAPADFLIGAGTVLDVQTAKECIAAGAQFIVSPILDPPTVAMCNKESIVVLPGALTPNEIVRAWELGADYVKVFPVDSMGGPAYIKALKGPLPHLRLVPTGGVSLQMARDFIKAGAAAVGVGGELVSLNALRTGDDQEIIKRAQHLMQSVKSAKAEYSTLN